MADVFNIEGMNKDGEVLLADCYGKLCDVIFPIEAMNAPKVMHYDQEISPVSLVFRINAAMHHSRVKPLPPVRINGTATKKYTVVVCDDVSNEEIQAAIERLKAMGYYAYTIDRDNTVKMYITWDSRCMAAPVYEDEEDNPGL